MNRLLVISALLLCGCTPFKWPWTNDDKKDEPVVVIDNKAKDELYNKAKEVASDAASALVAISPSVQDGVPRGLTDLTADRLSTISKPSVELVEHYRKLIREADIAGLEQERKRTAGLQESVTNLQKKVDDLETQLLCEQVAGEIIDKKAARASKDKTLWMFTCVGIAMFAGGVVGFVLPMNPFKKNSLFVSAGGLIAIGFAWIVDSEWFPYVAGGFVGISACMVLFLLGRALWLRTKGSGTTTSI